MNEQKKKRVNTGTTGIIFPTVLAVGLFIFSIFVIIIPAFKSNIMDRKREMIRELTNSAWSVLQEYAAEESRGNLSREEAQKRAIADIRYLRYGKERKDYFWITDMQPKMIMHPYLTHLEGLDLSGKEGEDPTGKKLFLEMVRVCRENGKGYVEYSWQWKDDATRIVPKVSFVESFEPWGWIIGTGIYVEDVKEEIANMTARLIKISIAIVFVIALLLFYIMQKSLKIEARRKAAEAGLRESEKKYRALVEAATEGTLMVLSGTYFYSNKIIRNLLGYTAEEFKQLDLYDIFPSETDAGETNDNTTNTIDKEQYKKFFQLQENGPALPQQYETRLLRKNGTTVEVALTASNISMGDEKGVILMVRDISGHKQVEEELDKSKEKYNVLTNNLEIGVFRSTTGRRGTIIEANPAAVRILGFQSREEIFKIAIFDLFHDKDERITIFKELSDSGFVKNHMLQLRRNDGTISTISISAVLVKDEKGVDRYCDGILEDITQQKQMEESRENLIVELQTAQLFFNRSIKHFLQDITQCSMNTPIRDAAALMTTNKYSAALVTGPGPEDSEEEQYIGIVTDRDLRERVVAEGLALETPVYQIMSAPLISISESALIFEAMLLMQEKKVHHLAVKNPTGRVISIISNEQLLHTQRSSSSYILKEIHEARGVKDIIKSHNRLPRLVKALIDSGANSQNICRIITAVSDAILERLIQLAIIQLGPPPADFTFVALGSEGRAEQTLRTDQDNAIIYEDLDDPEEKKQANEYFLSLGKMVCLWLDECGYTLCKGEIMAMTPKWCQPLSVWQKYFSQWIHTANPQDLLEVNIFFDFRCLYGEKEFTNRLRSSIADLLKDTPAFLQYIARNALLYKPPIGFFGNIVVESSGEKRSTFDIKEAMKPIVNFARIYALRSNISETNTQDRLYRLYTKNILTKSSYEEMVQVYDYLMQMRFKHQAEALNENREPDNFINPKMLTDIEHSLLKNTFTQINNFQKRLSYDFTGTA